MTRYSPKPRAPKPIGYKLSLIYSDNRPFRVMETRTELLPTLYRTQAEAVRAQKALQSDPGRLGSQTVPIYA